MCLSDCGLFEVSPCFGICWRLSIIALNCGTAARKSSTTVQCQSLSVKLNIAVLLQAAAPLLLLTYDRMSLSSRSRLLPPPSLLADWDCDLDCSSLGVLDSASVTLLFSCCCCCCCCCGCCCCRGLRPHKRPPVSLLSLTLPFCARVVC